MNEPIQGCMGKYPAQVVDMFQRIRQLIYDSSVAVPIETLWAKLPSYYVGKSFVRLILFKDHINIEARAAIRYKDKLTDYRFTPKGMLQVYLKQNIPADILKRIFAETLMEESIFE